MNKIWMTGRLTKEPEVRYAQGSTTTAIANISIAVDRKYKKEGQPEADFFSCTAFGKTAEFLEKYFSKGQKITLSGSLQNDTYEKDGQKRTITKIMIDEVEFNGNKNENTATTHQDAHTDDFVSIPKELEDGLPFN